MPLISSRSGAEPEDTWRGKIVDGRLPSSEAAAQAFRRHCGFIAQGAAFGVDVEGSAVATDTSLDPAPFNPPVFPVPEDYVFGEESDDNAE